MSYCRKDGKDIIIFATKENHDVPSTIKLSEPLRPPPGLIHPDGSINWNCPCLGGMATGPCGIEFRDAFSCFHYSKADPKGSDCLGKFKEMQDCMKQYPTLYTRSTGVDDFDDEDENDENQRLSSHANEENITTLNTTPDTKSK